MKTKLAINYTSLTVYEVGLDPDINVLECQDEFLVTRNLYDKDYYYVLKIKPLWETLRVPHPRDGYFKHTSKDSKQDFFRKVHSKVSYMMLELCVDFLQGKEYPRENFG